MKNHEPTTEMIDIYNAAKAGNSFIVEAKAGAGKTTTICEVIRQFVSAKKKVLYLVFNTHNIADAKSKLQGVDIDRNVVITNVHKLSFSSVGVNYRKKIGNMSFAKYKHLINSKDFDLIRSVRDAINCYFCSSEPEFRSSHIGTTRDINKKKIIFREAKKLIDRMRDPNDLDVMLPHDGYLHIFCCSDIGLSKLSEFDVVIVDESQDQNAPFVCLEQKYMNAGGQLIKIGDLFQSLYRFRGAVNANKSYTGVLPFLPLTKSFRFGQEIADVALKVLAVNGNTRERYTGNDLKNTEILPPGTRLNEPRVILHRTAAGVIRTTLELLIRKIPFTVVGGIRNYVTDELYWFESLRSGTYRNSKIPQYFLKTFPNWKAVEAIAKEGVDSDVSRIVKVFDVCSSSGYETIEALIADVEDQEISQNKPSESLALSTVHRFKGVEADAVVMSNDFKSLNEIKQLNQDDLTDEINILYVGVTRAIKKIVINDTINEIINCKKKSNQYR